MAVPEYRQTKRLYYVGLFILFGLLIAISVSIVNYRMEMASSRSQLGEQAEDVFASKLRDLELFSADLEDIVAALRDNDILARYIREPNAENYKNSTDLFYALSASKSTLMQLRYLDASGMEKVRVDRSGDLEQISIVEEDSLQDKSHRYYFKEVAQIAPNSFWYSRLDLNVENKKVEVPHKPVLRVATPVYVDQKFQGIIIVNVHARSFLDKFRRDSLFDISLVDGDGYHMEACEGEDSWTRYLGAGRSLKVKYPERGQTILATAKESEVQEYGDVFAGSVSSYLPRDKAVVVMHAKPDAVKGMEDERKKAAFLIVAIVLAFSGPLALLISRGPVNLHRKIAAQNRILMESMELIDKYVHTASLDDSGVFLEVSAALATTLGFDKAEIIGQKYDKLYSSDLPKEYYRDIWEKLEQGRQWSGEVKHRKKNGEPYWADTIILPTFDETNGKVGYSAIYQDVTDKKNIELISVTDVMTGLYNRRFFNTTIKNELNRARREEKILVFAMMDVDYFKQYNDHYGHQKGDEVLKDIAEAVQSRLGRGSDYCFRLGGEEFGMLFTDLQPDTALVFTESIRLAIETIGIEHKWSQCAEVVTVSIGLLSVTPGIGVTVDGIYKLADETLYMAKNKGRNRVEVQKLEPEI